MKTPPFHRPDAAQLTFRLFERSLHPELFNSYAKRSGTTPDCQFTIWICDTGHRLTVQTHAAQVTEITGARNQPLPTRGLTGEHRLDGCRDWSFQLATGLRWHYSAHVETVTTEVYRSLHQELAIDAQTAFLTHEFRRWKTSVRPAKPDRRETDAVGNGGLVADADRRILSVNRLSPSALSVIQVEVGPRTLGVRGFHTFPESQSILRIQSLVEFPATK